MCSNCIYWDEQKNPDPTNKRRKGFCHGMPPTVILLPGERSRVALGQEGAPLNFVPQMINPITDWNRRFCGQYSPDAETTALLNKAREQNAAIVDQDTQ